MFFVSRYFIYLFLMPLVLFSYTIVRDEKSLHLAIDEANQNSEITSIFFKKNLSIKLHRPLLYTGKQSLKIFANDAFIDASYMRISSLNHKKPQKIKEAALVFQTSANITITHLSLVNSNSRGMAYEIPLKAKKGLSKIFLSHVLIKGSALYGLHIDDNADDLDDGDLGSERSVKLMIDRSEFSFNGTKSIDFDGIRVDERSKGDVMLMISHSTISYNGGDGIEVDEGGKGSVDATLFDVSIHHNGYANKEDLDDGFDIDEEGKGDIRVSLIKVKLYDNKEDDLDFDERDSGDMLIQLNQMDNNNSALKNFSFKEKGKGNLKVIHDD